MRSLRQPLNLFLGVFLLAAMLFAASPASAHDVAESSSPAQGATVATPPEEVSITFNHDPLALGSQIRVTDATGTDWADGGVEIVDNVVSQKIKDGAPSGTFTVVWRVVSSDSHPIEGTFTFTATHAAGGTQAGAATQPPAAVPTLGTARPGTTVPDVVADSSEPFPWSLVIFAAVAVGLLVSLAVLARRRLVPSEDEVASPSPEEEGQDSSSGR